jgi:hypothetical protein
MPIERPRVTGSKWRYRPTPACGDLLVDWPGYLVSRRLLKSSRRSDFGESGHYQIAAGAVSKIATDRRTFKDATVRDRHDPAIPTAEKQSFVSRLASRTGNQHTETRGASLLIRFTGPPPKPAPNDSHCASRILSLFRLLSAKGKYSTVSFGRIFSQPGS